MPIESDSSLPTRYRLVARIGQGGMGEVFRTQDRLTGHMVALKRVRVPLGATQMGPPFDARVNSRLGQAATLTPLELLHQTAQAASAAVAVFARAPSAELQALRLHLTQEFRTLASLRHPNVVSVLDYGFDRSKQPYFTMELLEATASIDKAARGQSRAAQVGLLLQILQALTYLHRHRIVHRDIKPGNILVVNGRRGPQVKLLDFGLALLRRGKEAHYAEIAGTIGYIAPEVLSGHEANEASDLFAVGVIAHEILLGTHPVKARDTAGLMTAFLGSAPIFSEDEKLGKELSLVLRRALARVPAERYVDAAAFGREIASAAGLPLPVETIEIRESFLQAAEFVAREAEFGTLTKALGEAVSGRGAVWLVGGESGVGKSRLLDELRTLALVSGIRVVRGQAVSAGGAAYHVWQGALRPLCLDTALDELDAGVLQSVVPDIATLIERSVPEPCTLDPQSAQARLLLTMEKLLLAQSEPLLLLLEDLHWAEPASLAVLLRLLRTLARHPLLIIGSYRNDERPELPDELPGTQRLRLPRLLPAEMVSLSTSMLGEIGSRKDVVTLLEQETAGNAFFLVEVLRALAEEVGALGKIGSGRIPSRVMVGGVQAVLLRRLKRVPIEVRPLLCAAAVLGRELDLVVLDALAAELGGQVEVHLAACAAVSVLEVSENRWRFAHDKLREALLSEMAEQECRGWHRRIGETMESAYATDLGPHVAALGYHFEQAGEWAHALPYLMQAGERAMRSGAMQEAIAHLERAAALLDRAGATPVARAHARGLLCRAYYGAGQPEESAQILETMYAESGFPVPGSSLGLFSDIVRRAVHHALFRLRPQWSRPDNSYPDSTSICEVADAMLAAGVVIGYTRSPAHIVQRTLVWVSIAERTLDPVRMAPAYSNLGIMLSMTPFGGLADGYLRRSRELLAQASNIPRGVKEKLKGAEAFVHASRSEWAVATAHLDEELDYHRRAGDWSQALFALAQRSRIDLCCGDSGALLTVATRMEDLARRVDSAQYLCLGRCLHGILALRTGEIDHARRLLREAGEYEAQARDRPASILWGGYSALGAIRDDDAVEAQRFANATLKRLLSAPSLGSVDGVSALVETYLTLWAGTPGKTEKQNKKAEFDQPLRQSLAALRSLGAMFPIGRSTAFLWHGRYAALRGYTKLSEWLLQRALEASERCRMPLDEGLAHQALAMVAEARGEHGRAMEERRKASVLFERTGARWHLLQDSLS